MKQSISSMILIVVCWLGAANTLRGDLIATYTSGLLSSGTVGVYNQMGFHILGRVSGPGTEVFPIFDSLLFGNADSGLSFIVDSDADDADFSGLSGFLTDGNNLTLGFLSSMPPGVVPGGGVFGPESSFHLIPPENQITDYVIESFELVINTLNIQSPGENPNNDGNWTTADYNFTINVYGTVVPEPGTAGLLFIGSIILYATRRLNRRLV